MNGIILSIVAFLMGMGTAMADGLRPLPLATLKLDADIIVIGRVSEAERIESSHGEKYNIKLFEVRCLVGVCIEEDVISFLAPDGFKVGGYYLVFLELREGGYVAGGIINRAFEVVRPFGREAFLKVNENILLPQEMKTYIFSYRRCFGRDDHDDCEEIVLFSYIDLRAINEFLGINLSLN